MPLPYDIKCNVVWQDIQKAIIIITDVLTGHRIMAMISGDTGFGKSFLVKRLARKYRCPFHSFNPRDVNALVDLLWRMESGQITYKGQRIQVGLLDDVDSCARHETIANVLKGGFGEERRVIFHNKAAINNEARLDRDNPLYNPTPHSRLIPPTEFDLRIRLLWLTNVDFTLPEVIGATPEHFRALVSKGLAVFRIRNNAENGGRDVFLYTYWGATEGGFLKTANAGGGYRYAVARQTVEFYVQNVHLLRDISPRGLKQIADVCRDYPDLRDREQRLQLMLHHTDQRPKFKLPEPWVQVPLWPDRPPPRKPPEPPPNSPEPPPNSPERPPDPPEPPSNPPEPPPDPPEPPPNPPEPPPNPPEPPPNPSEPPPTARQPIPTESQEQTHPDTVTAGTELAPDENVEGNRAAELDATRASDSPYIGENIDREKLDHFEDENPRKRRVNTVSPTLKERDRIKSAWELKHLRGRVTTERHTLAIENRCRAYILIEATNDDAFIDQAHRALRDQNLLFWERIGDLDLDQVLAEAQPPDEK